MCGFHLRSTVRKSPPAFCTVPSSLEVSPCPRLHRLCASISKGLGNGSLNSNMHSALSGAREPFTPSHWMELEHQALIYKYINVNMPIPSNLLIPIRKAFSPPGYPGYSNSYRHNTWGWGPFHLGFLGNHDPEPGRCRRTDGKKWRCSRDAVVDQKYCERHINRGSHHSRKPVEGQTGQAAAGSAAAKVLPIASPSPAIMASGGGACKNLSITQHQVKSLQSGVVDNSSNCHINSCSNIDGIGCSNIDGIRRHRMLPLLP